MQLTRLHRREKALFCQLSLLLVLHGEQFHTVSGGYCRDVHCQQFSLRARILSVISNACSYLSPKTKWRMARGNGLRVDILNNFPSSQAIFWSHRRERKKRQIGEPFIKWKESFRGELRMVRCDEALAILSFKPV